VTSVAERRARPAAVLPDLQRREPHRESAGPRRSAALLTPVTYTGAIPSQELDRETVAVQAQDDDNDAQTVSQVEPSFLLSSPAYPQNVVTDYAGRAFTPVPPGFGCVGSGQLTAGDVAARRGHALGGRSFVFTPTSRSATSRSWRAG
jgi:hypothetical protein